MTRAAHIASIVSRWQSMRSRCYNPKHPSYRYYGGRGIGMCDEWRFNRYAFADWSLANGFQPHLTIERIENDGNYEPGNCKWATRVEQAANKSNGPVCHTTLDSLTGR